MADEASLRAYPAIKILATVYRILACLTLPIGILAVYAAAQENLLIGLLCLIGVVSVSLLQWASAQFLDIATNIAADLQHARQSLAHMRQYYDR